LNLSASSSRKIRLGSVIVFALLMGSLFGYRLGLVVGTPSASQTAVGGQFQEEKPCSFYVFTDGTNYYAQNCDTGGIIYGGPNNAGGVTGTSAAGVIQAAINAAGKETEATVAFSGQSFPLAVGLTIVNPVGLEGQPGSSISNSTTYGTRLYASTSMTNLILWKSDSLGNNQDAPGSLSNLILDCNSNAKYGLELIGSSFTKWSSQSLTVSNCKNVGVLDLISHSATFNGLTAVNNGNSTSKSGAVQIGNKVSGEYGNNFVILGSNLEDNKGAGLTIIGGAGGYVGGSTVIESNSYSGINGTAATVVNSQGVTINGVTLENDNTATASGMYEIYLGANTNTWTIASIYCQANHVNYCIYDAGAINTFINPACSSANYHCVYVSTTFEDATYIGNAGSASQPMFTFIPGAYVTVENSNVVGLLSNIVTTGVHATPYWIGYSGNGTAILASTTYTVSPSNIILSCTGGTAVVYTVKDWGGYTVSQSPLAPDTLYIPAGFKVNFGAFSGAPTCLVASV